MDTRGSCGKHWRSRGAVDRVDLTVGIVLVLLVPFLCYVVALACGVRTESEEGLFRQQPEVEKPRTDSVEVELHWKVARELYDVGKSYMSARRDIEDEVLKDYYRRWAKRSLDDASQRLKELAVMIQWYPDTESLFSEYLTEIRRLERTIGEDLKYLRSLDILGLDRDSRGASEREMLRE